MSEGVAAALITWGLKQAGGQTLKWLVAPPEQTLIDRLEDATRAWNRALPGEERFGDPVALFALVPESPELGRPAFEALHTRLSAAQLPDEDQWCAALLEQWHSLKEGLGSSVGLGGLVESEAVEHVAELARLIHIECQTDARLFRRAVLEFIAQAKVLPTHEVLKVAVDRLREAQPTTDAEVHNLLADLGHSALEDSLESIYIHGLVHSVRRETLPAALLNLLIEPTVVAGFDWAISSGSPELTPAARWAVAAFRESRAMRGVGVDVEETVRFFFGTLCELRDRARSPGQQEVVQLLREVHDELIRRAASYEVLPSERDLFAKNLSDWLDACGYILDSTPTPRNETAFDLLVTLPGRRRREKPETFFVRGTTEPVRAGDLEDLPTPGEVGRSGSWLVSSVAVSQGARERAADLEDGREVLAFDELVDEVVHFDKYEEFLSEEVSRRRLMELYVPLDCRRPEVDAQGIVRGETEGPLQDLVDRWLDRPISEHISILGEFGTGKTWFTLHYAHRRLQEYREAAESGRLRGRYPLLIQLRDYAKAVSAQSILSEFFFDRFEVGIPSLKAFDVLNRMGRFVLLFDGFDELARKVDYQMVVDNFWELGKIVVPGSKALLTCRNEHFRYESEARSVLGGKVHASTKILLSPPRFDVVLLQRLSTEQVALALSRRTTGSLAENETTERVLKHSALVDLARRPVMLEMVIACLDELMQRSEVRMAQVYLLAADAQIRRNIEEKRTFTSISDKVLFLCEVAWEMHVSERLKLNYKLFGDRIRAIFGSRVAEEEVDHWRYDLMGQTLLVRDAEGNYSFGHRGFVEFFCAYKLLAQVGGLQTEFVDRFGIEGGGEAPAHAMTVALPLAWEAWGGAPLHQNLTTFLAEMVGEPAALLRLIQSTRDGSSGEVGYAGGNAASVLVRQSRDGLVGASLVGTSLRGARLSGAELYFNGDRADLREADLLGADLRRVRLRGARLDGATLRGLQASGRMEADENVSMVLGGPKGAAWVFNVAAEGFISVLGQSLGVRGCDRAVSPDGKFFLVHQSHQRLLFGKLGHERTRVAWTICVLDASERVYDLGLTWHPGGSFLIVDYQSGRTWHLTPPTGKVSEGRSLWATPSCPGLAARHPYVVLGNKVWSEESGSIVADLGVSLVQPSCRPRFSPNGLQLSLITADGLETFDTQTWSRSGLFQGHAFTGHGWSQDGTKIAVAGERGVTVIDTVSGAMRLQVEAWRAEGVAFLADGGLVIADSLGSIELRRPSETQHLRVSQDVPLCTHADFRGASGLDETTRAALRAAGAKISDE